MHTPARVTRTDARTLLLTQGKVSLQLTLHESTCSGASLSHELVILQAPQKPLSNVTVVVVHADYPCDRIGVVMGRVGAYVQWAVRPLHEWAHDGAFA